MSRSCLCRRRAGGTAPAVISAANEIAVDAFIDGEITWAQIHDVSAAVLAQQSFHSHQRWTKLLMPIVALVRTQGV